MQGAKTSTEVRREKHARDSNMDTCIMIAATTLLGWSCYLLPCGFCKESPEVWNWLASCSPLRQRTVVPVSERWQRHFCMYPINNVEKFFAQQKTSFAGVTLLSTPPAARPRMNLFRVCSIARHHSILLHAKYQRVDCRELTRATMHAPFASDGSLAKPARTRSSQKAKKKRRTTRSSARTVLKNARGINPLQFRLQLRSISINTNTTRTLRFGFHFDNGPCFAVCFINSIGLAGTKGTTRTYCTR